MFIINREKKKKKDVWSLYVCMHIYICIYKHTYMNSVFSYLFCFVLDTYV